MRPTKPRGEEFWNDPSDPRHGTTNGYSNLRCRCELCTEAWRQYHLVYMHSHPEQLERHSDYMHRIRGKETRKPYVPQPHRWAEEPTCTCGEPETEGVNHRWGTPCFYYEVKDAESA